jgi:hypothetical protein
LVFRNGTTDVGYNGVGVRYNDMGVGHNDMGIGHNDVGVRNTLADVGNCYMCIDGKFSLKTDNQRYQQGNDRIHLKDVKDPVQIQLPGRDLFFIVLGVEKA